MRLGKYNDGRADDKMLMERIQSMSDYRIAGPNLSVRLLDKERAQEVPGSVYRTIGDIAMVLYLILSDDLCCGSSRISMRVTTHQAGQWKIGADSLFEAAMQKTVEREPPRLYHLDALLSGKEQEGNAFMEPNASFTMAEDPSGDCLTTVRRRNGAVAAFYPGVAAKLSQKLGRDFYLAFTSIHEAMIHPVDVIPPQMLSEILRDTICEATREEDFLSWGIFRYYQEEDQIRQVL